MLTVTAAETVLHGGPGALIAASDAATIRAVAGGRLAARGCGLAGLAARARARGGVAARVALVGVSLVLDLPRLTGTFRGYPDDQAAVARVARSPLRTAFSLLPDALRRDILGSQGRRMAATGAFAGPPSVAHAEALLRGVARRGARLDEPVDALVVGVPWIGPHVPRESLNPVTVAAVALGLALRLRRDAFPIRPGGSLILIHPLTRSFAHGHAGAVRGDVQRAARRRQDPDELAEAERAAPADERALAAYRAGTCLPSAPPVRRLGGMRSRALPARAVIVGGCRDAVAARTLGFVPSHGIGSALEMAHGVAGGRARVGILLAPPYAPLLVG